MDGRRATRRTPSGFARWPGELRVCTAFILTLMSGSALGDWTPPANPNPDKILSEAQDDARAGRYEDALAKHVWFHQNALKYAPAMAGVRLSFALMYWRELADVYPAALTKLKAIRDEAEAGSREGSDPRRAFLDAAAINRELGEPGRTKDLFLWLDANKPEVARKTFDAAEPALIASKEYQLCGKYLDPDRQLKRHVDLYRLQKTMAHDEDMKDHATEINQLSTETFARDAATLVALLALNERHADAERIAAEAVRESDYPALKTMIAKALKGELPPRWP
jgi:hypothetical protein